MLALLHQKERHRTCAVLYVGTLASKGKGSYLAFDSSMPSDQAPKARHKSKISTKELMFCGKYLHLIMGPTPYQCQK